METEEIKFIKAFNNGYTLSKFEPTLLASILKNLSPTTKYLQGLFAGKQEFDLEISAKELDDLHRLRDRSISHDRDLGKDP